MLALFLISLALSMKSFWYFIFLDAQVKRVRTMEVETTHKLLLMRMLHPPPNIGVCRDLHLFLNLKSDIDLYTSNPKYLFSLTIKQVYATLPLKIFDPNILRALIITTN